MTTKFCKDCKHFTPSYKYTYAEKCTKYTLHIDIVRGYITYRSCHEARFRSDLCGFNGKDFDPKPTLTQRVIQFFKPAPTTK